MSSSPDGLAALSDSPPGNARRQSEPLCPKLPDVRLSGVTGALARGSLKGPSGRLLPTRSESVDRARPSNLRLPSFEALGIAMPHHIQTHEERIVTGRLIHEKLSVGNLHLPTPLSVEAVVDSSTSTNGSHALGVPRRSITTSQLHRSPAGYLLTLTPPDESCIFDWRTTTGDEPPSSLTSCPAASNKPLQSPALAAETGAIKAPSDAEEGGSSRRSSNTQGPSQPDDSTGANLPNQANNQADRGTAAGIWLDDAIVQLVENSLGLHAAEGEVKIVCQTLPHPPRRSSDQEGFTSGAIDSRRDTGASTRSGFAPPTAIVPLTESILERVARRNRRCYIQIHHVVESALINLEHLPSSPPLTSGTPLTFSGPSSPDYFASGLGSGGTGGSPGYFTRSVFNTAVPVLPALATQSDAPRDLGASYDEWLLKQQTAPLPSPNPVVPPLSHQLSILERYIPPPSPEEDQKIFSNVSSTLVDRLFELSPRGGSLLFIYPTKTGAETFTRDYLGPILAPVLRGLMSIHHLPSQLCEQIDHMRAVEFMADYEGLRSKIGNMCDRSGPDNKVRLGYGKRVDVQMDPQAWMEWWVLQESARIKRVCQTFFNLGFDIKSQLSAGDLARAIIDGVQSGIRRQADMGLPAMQVGVFVLGRVMDAFIHLSAF